MYLVQQSFFSSEIKHLESNKPIKHTKLLKLNPFLDRGLLRIGGRLSRLDLCYEEKHPLILPAKGNLVALMVRNMHQRTQRGGTQLTLRNLRLRYWILKGRQAVKGIVNKCTVCLRYSAKPETQLMGSLPKERVTPAFAFEHAGVDFAGSFKLRLTKSRGKGTLKAYVSVFICLSTKAVHLEAWRTIQQKHSSPLLRGLLVEEGTAPF